MIIIYILIGILLVTFIYYLVFVNKYFSKYWSESSWNSWRELIYSIAQILKN